MNEIKSSDWTAILQSVAQVMTDNADHLCEMDARMGDGDLGLTMKKGYCALPEIYVGLEEADMGKRLSKSGMKMSSVVPSTMGTLMSSGWMEGGKRLVGKETVDAAGYAAFLRGFADGIIKRGKCAPGDRTVLDAVQPAAEAAEKAGLKTPAISVIGPVVELKNTLSWFGQGEAQVWQGCGVRRQGPGHRGPGGHRRDAAGAGPAGRHREINKER